MTAPSGGEHFSVDDIPKFGVPDRIRWRDVPFVVAVGLPLTIALWGVLGMALKSLGRAASAEDPLAVMAILVTTGLGPAIAYHLQRALRAAHLSRAIGCLGLVAWTLTVLVAASLGPLITLLVAIAGALGGVALLARRIARQRGAP